MASLQSIFTMLLILVIVAGIVGYYRWQDERSRDLLYDWAARNGYEIVQRQRVLILSPYLFRSARGQTVYRVLVRMPDGSLRPAHARCGSFLFGLWENQLDVRWEDTGLSGN